ncbi:MAG: coproporphyrinogen dehydrogenase HemZ [Clostridia bacterium]|nr:coproporphyrinogen dehydrogenase HemZ [Clostridia bacterium]
MRGRPWGVLTGVRPTKKARKLLSQGISYANLPKILRKEYKLHKPKINLLLATMQNQEIVQCESLVDFYVNIPICPTRCSYCSFISAELKYVEKILPDYLDVLVQEIHEAKEIIAQNNLKVRSVYVGGGTPTVLSARQLEQILMELDFGKVEFTVECGRPDTITKEKLLVLKKYGVSRISINPQTFSEKTLQKIQRKHTVQDVFDAFALAKSMGFSINMDLIAGFEGENFATFKKSLGKAMDLKPDNLTVHTLSIKRGSCLQGQRVTNKTVSKMVNFASKKLLRAGYVPYYLYRQKNQLGNLENIGYTRPGKQCIFNVDSMEETVSIMACGANAISKMVDHKNQKITRAANAKFLPDYINRIKEEINKKINLFQNK